jgi:hypothetical protein
VRLIDAFWAFFFGPVSLPSCSNGLGNRKFVSRGPPTLWTTWCGPRESVPDPQGQRGGPQGPAANKMGPTILVTNLFLLPSSALIR